MKTLFVSQYRKFQQSRLECLSLHLLRHQLPWFVVVLFFCLFVFVVLGGLYFWFCLVSCFCVLFAALGQLDGLRKGPHSLSFAAFSSDGFACFPQFISDKYKLVERPGESHEGVGRKKKSPTSPADTADVAIGRPESSERTSPDVSHFEPTRRCPACESGMEAPLRIDLSNLGVLKSGWVTAYTYGMEFISKGGVKI